VTTIQNSLLFIHFCSLCVVYLKDCHYWSSCKSIRCDIHWYTHVLVFGVMKLCCWWIDTTSLEEHC